MPTKIYHVTANTATITCETTVAEFLTEWEFSITPTLITNPENPLHAPTPSITIHEKYAPSLMIEHTTRNAQEYEFFTELTDFLTTPLTITEEQIHPTQETNTIRVNPNTGVTFE